ncbi:hypothetical protein KEM52_003757 [Ascosphaera acerosa]|nr:hypothetical protein KEM52_003757 [Ascosphaera acerosa]
MKRAREGQQDGTPAKRHAALPVLDSGRQDEDEITKSSMKTALHVLRSEKEALEHAERLYSTDAAAIAGMEDAVRTIARTIQRGAKLVISGMGKSGKIGQKMAATMNSLGIISCFLHPTEAMHGDLGVIRPHDTILAISYSGKTKEISDMMSHVPPSTTLIAITRHLVLHECPLLRDCHNIHTILLPAPVHMSEEECFGLAAPTTSTTVALALGDALALAVASELHPAQGRSPAEVFGKHHPGGAIGAAASRRNGLATPPEASSPSSGSSSDTAPSPDLITPPTSVDSASESEREQEAAGHLLGVLQAQLADKLTRPLSDFAVPPADVAQAYSALAQPEDVRVVDVMRAAMRGGGYTTWVKTSPAGIIPPSRLRRLCEQSDPLQLVSQAECAEVREPQWIRLGPTATVSELLEHLNLRAGSQPGERDLVDLEALLDGQIAVLAQEDGATADGFIDAVSLL